MSKRYRVYVSYGYPGCPDEYEIMEFPDDTLEEEIERDCKACCETLLGNFDSGWYQLEDGADE